MSRNGIPGGRIVFSGLVFDIVHVPGRDGGPDLEFAAAADSVRVYPWDQNNVVHLIRERRQGLEAEETLRVVSGSLEAEETPTAAAARELLEEIGCRAATLRVFHTSVTQLKVLNRIYHVLATDLSWGPSSPEPGESIERVAIPAAELDDFVWSGAIAEDPIALALLKLTRARLGRAHNTP